MDQCLRPAVLHTVCTSQSQTIPFLTSNIQAGFAVLREQVGVTPLKASCQGIFFTVVKALPPGLVLTKLY